jgi:hypothetical protein
MKRILYIVPFLTLSISAFAQDSLRVGDMVDLEEKVMVKKMQDELNKPNPNMPPIPTIVSVPQAPRIVYPTETLAVYGTSATYYEGQLSMGGRTFTVRKGTPVQGYIVSSIGPQGIELSKTVYHPKKRKAGPNKSETKTVFAPLAAR